MEDVEHRQQDDRRPLVRRRRVAVGDREDEREHVGHHHARRREHGEQGELEGVQGRLGKDDRGDDTGQDQDAGYIAEPPPQAAHRRPQRRDPIYGLSRGP